MKQLKIAVAWLTKNPSGGQLLISIMVLFLLQFNFRPSPVRLRSPRGGGVYKQNKTKWKEGCLHKASINTHSFSQHDRRFEERSGVPAFSSL